MINITEVDFPCKVGGQYIFKGTYIKAGGKECDGIVCIIAFKINGRNLVFSTSDGGGGMQYHFDQYINKMQKPFFVEGKWFEIS